MTDLDETLRRARRDSMAKKAMTTMNDLLDYVNYEDAKSGAEDVVDVMEVWSQVLGGALAAIPGGDKNTWEEFAESIVTNVALAYELRWDIDNGEHDGS